MNSREIEDLKSMYCNSEKWSERLIGPIGDPGPSGIPGSISATGNTGPVGPQAYCERCAHKRVCMYRKDIKALISKGAIISCYDWHIEGVQGEKGCR